MKTLALLLLLTLGCASTAARRCPGTLTSSQCGTLQALREHAQAAERILGGAR